ncbi:hypothetical protein THRCLA_04404 [Thraustotheca clavata]|uniref:Uncharacterized protein n=1 Tax=Thraustotheca clavata TaxID=74557 RepID=A0A1V9ZZ43_9STRA|nr:hypothetical protein THRCLA_04404 [Thraustotheca clavata]
MDTKSIAQTELQQLKETLRRLSAVEEPHLPLKMSAFTPTASNNKRSSPTNQASASNSKAVLAALKALQDKIRRVEEEKAALEDECASLRAQVRLSEAQHTSGSKKSKYELEQVREAARAAYEALRAERDTLQSDLVKAQHAHEITKNELEHVQDVLATYKEKNDTLEEQNTMQDANILRLQKEVAEMSSTSKERVKELQEALLEVTRVNKDASRKIEQLTEQLERTTKQNTTLEARIQDTERTIAQVSHLNEKLVMRMWEAQVKSKPKAKSKPAAPTVTRSTAASRAQSAPTLRPPSTKKKITKKTKKSKNNLERLEEANMAKVPFLLGTAVTPSFSVIGNAQEALRSSELYTSVAPDTRTTADYKSKAPAEISTQEPVSKTSFMSTMHKAIESVEDEFQQLNDRYKSILASVEHEKKPDVSQVMEETIDALETKSNQLQLLKQLEAQAAKSTLHAMRKIVHSPDAALKKAKALRVLQEYRKLDRHIKSRTPDEPQMMTS